MKALSLADESRHLINKIMECRTQYLVSFGLDPDFVVIPWAIFAFLILTLVTVLVIAMIAIMACK